jgi:periplasmic protein TonB
MGITKFDLYNPEWLEIVFDSKNKEYGAYDLRKHYAQNLVKAMAIAFFSVAFLYTAYSILKPKQEATITRVYDPTILIPPPVKDNVKPVVPPKPQTTHPQTQVNTIKYPILVAKPDKEAENPPKLTDLQTSAISTQTAKGPVEAGNIDIPEGPGDGGMKDVAEDTKPKEMYEIQVLPQPYGGEAAWAKFLQRNMRYPQQAIDAKAQGKVFLSFVVEKDGHISSIVVERGVGYGLDEEAVRVLKLAPAWKPGIQNGHPVRVKFTMPITFQLNDPD